jgi:hypothetical protein
MAGRNQKCSRNGVTEMGSEMGSKSEMGSQKWVRHYTEMGSDIHRNGVTQKWHTEMGSDTIIISDLDNARPPYPLRACGAVTQRFNRRLELLAAERPAFVCAVAYLR